jgi:predicted phage terminase large subunit-like protein
MSDTTPKRITPKQTQELRQRCQTDLYFLGKNVLGKDLEEQPHREVCDFFIHKNPDIKSEEWSEYKSRLLMIPRGSFKSTLDVVDCVQSIIADPDIRILIVTAEMSLAEAFVAELRNYFLVREDVGPTQFQMLFPEFCLPAKTKTLATEFTTPARKNFKKEPTVWASSTGSQMPGWHCDVLKLDDVVNNLNSNDDTQSAKIIANFNFARKLVDPGGYIDVIGTPYSPIDLYAYIQKHFDEEETFLKYIRPAWSLKLEARGIPEEKLTAEHFDLFFPARLTYKFLKKEQKYDPVTFGSQYLIDPRAAVNKKFDETAVRNCVISWKSIPSELSYYAAWDLGYKKTQGANSTSGPVMAVDKQGRMYLMNMTWGLFSMNELTFNIADTCRRYPLQITGIEDVNGAQWLSNDIDAQCVKLGTEAKIFWIPVDRTKDAKYHRIMRLSPLFEKGKLFISDACPYVDDIIDQFLNFTGSKNGADDMIDAISFFPRFVNLIPHVDIDAEAHKKEWEKVKRDCMKRLLYPDEQIIPQGKIEEVEPDFHNYF